MNCELQATTAVILWVVTQVVSQKQQSLRQVLKDQYNLNVSKRSGEVILD